jgi:aminoglycoside phosphotransferase (APT) family kinase protein
VVRALAHIQVESAGNIDELFAEGCPDRRLHTLPGELRALLADESVLADLTDAEREKLVGFTPKIEAICERLAGYAVPHSLVHGDFHSNNIAIKEGKPVIFDWTDGCVAHPFVDLPVLLEYDTPKDVPDARERIRDAYLQAWTAYEPMERLVEAFALGEVVAALHQAISYRYIVASLDDSQKGQLHGGTSQWLRVLLRYAD